MSLYVELGFPKDAAVDVAATARAGARRSGEGGASSRISELVAEHSVVMDPAYVHITAALARRARASQGAPAARRACTRIGRYGGWTYCSIEDNIVEARALAASR